MSSVAMPMVMEDILPPKIARGHDCLERELRRLLAGLIPVLAEATISLMRKVAEVLRDMVSAGVITDYAVFGAVAQMRYTEAVSTMDAEIAGVPRGCEGRLSCSHCVERGKTEGLRADPRHVGIRFCQPGRAGAFGGSAWALRTVARIPGSIPWMMQWTTG